MIAMNKKHTFFGNFQGTSLLSIIGKTLAGILLDQLLLMMATVYSQNNCGFKPQGNWHNLFALCQK